MENHDKTFNTICRVCLNHVKAEKMVSLIDNSDENGLSPYGISFEELTKISVKQNDYLPTKICHKCKKSIEKIVIFLNKSAVSDRKLGKVINFSLRQELDDDMVKEVVRQYTLFNLNFPDEPKPSSRRGSSSNYDEEQQAYSEKHIPKNENKYPNIKVEIEVQKVSHGTDSDDDYNARSSKPRSPSDNVDIFLNSVEKLVTTKPEGVEMETPKDQPLPKQATKVPEQDLTCPVCKRVLANRVTYKNHVQRHGTCRYICDQCGKSYPVHAELTQHQIYRHGIGSTFQCDQCSFKAVRKLELIEHIRLHTGERPFTCEKCGSTFRRLAIYKTHLKSHGEKTIACEYCPRKFYRRSEMLSHANNIHDRVYVFLCKVCNVSYAMAKTVRRHMFVKHGIPRNEQGKVVRVNKSPSRDNTLVKEGRRCEDSVRQIPRNDQEKLERVHKSTNPINSFMEGNEDDLRRIVQLPDF